MPSPKTTVNTLAADMSWVVELFHRAADRVPAYKDFLTKHGVRPAAIKTIADFAGLPAVDKAGYFDKYSLAELSWDGRLQPRLVSMSSGSTGQAYFWPRGDNQSQTVARLFDRLYRDILALDQTRTLVIICFSLGAWIAGLENYLATYAAANDRHLTIFTAGIDQAEALKAVKKLSADFDQTILCGYPPFMKDTLEAGASEGIDWAKLNTRLLTAGEAIGESWRDAVLKLLGSSEVTSIINYYGMAEAGTIAHETPATIALRRRLEAAGPDAVPAMFSGSGVGATYQYYPTSHFFEAAEGQLLLTYDAGLPLIRYATNDHGGVLPFEQARQLADGELSSDWNLPMVYLFGRKNLSATLYAVNIYPENVKAALADPELSKSLSDKFQIQTKHDATHDQFLEVTVELKPGITDSPELKKLAKQTIIQKLLELNSEYAKLHSAIGDKADPHIELVAPGQLGFLPGKKHRWVKSA